MARSCNRHESELGRPIPLPETRRYVKVNTGKLWDEVTATRKSL